MLTQNHTSAKSINITNLKFPVADSIATSTITDVEGVGTGLTSSEAVDITAGGMGTTIGDLINVRMIAMAKVIGNAAKVLIKYTMGFGSRTNLRRELNTMPDYLLLDIGVQRDQINSIVSGEFKKDNLVFSPISDQPSSVFYKDQGDTPIAA